MQPRTRLVWMCSLLAVLMLLTVIFTTMWLTSRRPPLTREQAERESYLHLQSYCNRNNLDIRLFGEPEVIRGQLEHYTLDKKQRLASVWGPTWDFHYTYKVKPFVTVVISYDETDRTTELVDVLEPGERRTSH